MELECGVTVYPARREGDRWRAVWYENGKRRQCEAVAEDKLAAKLAKVTERLGADAPSMEQPGADLIAWYLSPDRHPAGRSWSRRHADTQRRLCARFVAPLRDCSGSGQNPSRAPTASASPQTLDWICPRVPDLGSYRGRDGTEPT